MISNEIDNYINTISEYRDYLKSLQKALHDIKENDLLKQYNYEIVYAIDFSELKPFCFPFSEQKRLIKGLATSIEYSKYREKISHLSLFTEYDSLILLPPHKIELKRYLKNVRNEMNYVIHNYDDEYDILKNKFLQSDNFVNIKEILYEFKDHALIDDIKRRVILEFIQQHFMSLNILSMIPLIHGIEKLDYLKSKNKIKYFEDEYDEIGINEELLRKNAVPWYDSICSIRSSDNKEHQNYIDALACVYLVEINEYYKKNNVNKIIAIISRSMNLNKVLDTNAKRIISHHHYSLTRNLVSVILEYITTYDTMETKDASIEILQKDIKCIMKTYESLNTKNVNIFDKIKLKETHDQILNIYESIRRKENVSYYKTGAIELNNFREITSYDSKMFEQILSILVSLLESDEKFEEQIRATLSDSSQKLIELSDALEENMKSVSNLKSIEKIINLEVKTRKNITLHGLSGEMPTSLNFSNEYAIKLANEIFSSTISEFQIPSIKQYLEKIKQIHIKHDSTELIILKSFLEACAGYWETALTTLYNGTLPNGEEHNIEVLYFKSFLCRKTEKTLMGIEACIHSFKLSQSDARILREYSVLIWQSYTHNDNELLSDVAQAIGQKPTRQLALQYAEEALRITVNNQLKLRCLNSIAYYYAESDNYIDILEAEKILEKLNVSDDSVEILPGRVYDTAAFIFYRKSLLTPLDDIEKANLLRVALDFSNKSIKSRGLIKSELYVSQKTRFNIIEKLQDYKI
ncbi:MAG: hypothetical protein PVH88_05155 [Ignavibacteria bacterium]|jgi:hypothetical protein